MSYLFNFDYLRNAQIYNSLDGDGIYKHNSKHDRFNVLVNDTQFAHSAGAKGFYEGFEEFTFGIRTNADSGSGNNLVLGNFLLSRYSSFIEQKRIASGCREFATESSLW